MAGAEPRAALLPRLKGPERNCLEGDLPSIAFGDAPSPKWQVVLSPWGFFCA